MVVELLFVPVHVLVVPEQTDAYCPEGQVQAVVVVVMAYMRIWWQGVKKKKQEKHNQNSMKCHDINLCCVQSAAMVAGQFPSTTVPVQFHLIKCIVGSHLYFFTYLLRSTASYWHDLALVLRDLHLISAISTLLYI